MTSPKIVVEKTLTIAADIETAYDVFTRQLGSWWPIEGFSIAGNDSVSAVLEEAEGGKVYEVDAVGEQYLWGTVVHWDPPNGLSVQWHPGRPTSEATLWTVQFTQISSGVTELHLEHSGWEVLGESGTEVAAGYTSGWDDVLRPYLVATTD